MDRSHQFLRFVRIPADVYLRQSVCLTAACTHTPLEWVERLVGIVDQGTERQPEQVQPDFPGDSRFSQLCLRKLYVLCTRGAEASAPQGGLLQVQRPAPLLLLSDHDNDSLVH